MVKYLYKYVYKEPDRAMMTVEVANHTGNIPRNIQQCNAISEQTHVMQGKIHHHKPMTRSSNTRMDDTYAHTHAYGDCSTTPFTT
jgi:conjugal transfer/entry exclusion protein